MLMNGSQSVWELITDTTRWPEWGPSVTAVVCRDRFIKKGSCGKVKTRLGIWVPFVITHYEDNRYWAWQIWGIPATGHRIEPLDEYRCSLAFEVPAFAAPYLFICWIAINRIEAIIQNAE